jgi:hypothetical protein
MLKMIRQQSYLPLSFYFIYDRIENEALIYNFSTIVCKLNASNYI